MWADTALDIRVACLCLYIVPYPTLHVADGCILHYFTLLRDASGRVYLNSSYASDYVCVAQCTTALSRRAFERFCIAIGEPIEAERVIRAFFATFFLPKNRMQARVEHESERTHSLSPDECIDAEVRVYTHNRYPIAVGQLFRYSAHLREVTDGLFGTRS